MAQKRSSSRRGIALALFAAALMAAGAVVGLVNYSFLASSVSSAQSNAPASATLPDCVMTSLPDQNGVPGDLGILCPSLSQSNQTQAALSVATAAQAPDCQQIAQALGADQEVPNFSCASASQAGAGQVQAVAPQTASATQTPGCIYSIPDQAGPYDDIGGTLCPGVNGTTTGGSTTESTNSTATTTTVVLGQHVWF